MNSHIYHYNCKHPSQALPAREIWGWGERGTKNCVKKANWCGEQFEILFNHMQRALILVGGYMLSKNMKYIVSNNSSL